jgi:glycolate oxidase
VSAPGSDVEGALSELERIVGPEHVRRSDRIPEEDTHDESLTVSPVTPLAVVRPENTEEVSRILALAQAEHVPVVARGGGTGLSGGALPVPEGIVVAFDRMDRILEVDDQNHVAVAQPGVTLAALDEVLRPRALLYPVNPGEMSASLGGTVNTNAGGMRAIRYGVTRHHVLGLELVLAGGHVLRTGGRYVKSSSGYDLTQLVVGSEGTLALVTEVTVRLVPRLPHTVTLLAPFSSLEEIARAVPPVVRSGVAPLVLEYLDALTMAAIADAAGLDLGVPDDVREASSAYLVVVLESGDVRRLDEDTEVAATLLGELGALDVYVLPPSAGLALITARERAFYVAKAAGADDIVDTVVPRAAIPHFLAEVARLSAVHASLISGCGHVGDGNVHLSVFQPDPAKRDALLHAIFEAAAQHGGAVSGEHGIGTEKQAYFLALEQPEKLALMRRIKAAFDPDGILGPGRLLDTRATNTCDETGRRAHGGAIPATQGEDRVRDEAWARTAP